MLRAKRGIPRTCVPWGLGALNDDSNLIVPRNNESLARSYPAGL